MKRRYHNENKRCHDEKMFVCLFTSFYALFSAFGGIPIKAQEQDPPTAIEFTQESIDQLEYEMGKTVLMQGNI